RHVEYRIGEAAVARSVQTSVEPQLEDRARAGTSDRQLRRDGLGNGQVALPAELERLELDVAPVDELLARPQSERAEVEDSHHGQSSNAPGAASCAGRRPRRAPAGSLPRSNPRGSSTPG